MITSFERSRYPAAWLAVPHTEQQVQADILRALRQCKIIAHAFDAGGKSMRSRAGGGGAGAGMAGLPDIVGILPGGRALFIEVKKPAYITQKFQTGRNFQFTRAGVASAAQIDFIARAVAQGAAAGFAWSVGDALAIAGPKRRTL